MGEINALNVLRALTTMFDDLSESSSDPISNEEEELAFYLKGNASSVY